MLTERDETRIRTALSAGPIPGFVLGVVALSSMLPGCTRPSDPNGATKQPSAVATESPSYAPAVLPRIAPTDHPSAVPSAADPAQTGRPTEAARPSESGLSTAVPGRPVGDDRFGVIAQGPGIAHQLQTLDIEWYIDGNPDPGTAPPGRIKVPLISVKPGQPRIAEELVRARAAAAPGSYWYLGLEVNVPTMDGISPQAYVAEFDYYSTAIRSADPAAKILGPSILNWTFTCTLCRGFTPGAEWMADFLTEYARQHEGRRPAVDAWAIDIYPLTWDRVPMVDSTLVLEQIDGYRGFLDSNGLTEAPIWVTEFASHWAYAGWGVKDGRLALAPGLDFDRDYQWEAMESYLTDIVEGLLQRSSAMRIERWFLFIAYWNIRETIATDGYAGMYLFESGEVGAELNQLGELYRDYAAGTKPAR